MTPAVRAEYERALDQVTGDGAFAVRFERWFGDLRGPLQAVYGDDPRFADAWRELLATIAATAAARTDELRALDHEREITPDWLHREQAVGYVKYVDRFGGTLAGVRERPPRARAPGARPAPPCRISASSASATCTSCRSCARGRRRTTAATRSSTTARSSRRSARWTTCARWRRTCARPGWRCASTSCSTTPRASMAGPGRRWPATRASSPTTGRSPIAPSPTRTS